MASLGRGTEGIIQLQLSVVILAQLTGKLSALSQSVLSTIEPLQSVFFINLVKTRQILRPAFMTRRQYSRTNQNVYVSALYAADLTKGKHFPYYPLTKHRRLHILLRPTVPDVGKLHLVLLSDGDG